ncbi:MAG: ShlB/FhaC/HecB family hemolysin secretion/activation protein [Candidatus Krumholzibacteriia bacterium]
MPDARAAADSVDAFWRTVDEGWLEPMDPELHGFGLDEAELDSLAAVGSRKLDALETGRLWQVRPQFLERITFNRVQGLTLGAGLRVRKAGLFRPQLTVGAAYRFGTERPLYDAALEWPLVVRHRWLPRGLGRGAPYQVLRLELEGYQEMRLFAGDDRRGTRALAAALYGADPNQYFEARGGTLRLRMNTGRGMLLHAAGSWEEHRALSVTTDDNLLGEPLDPRGNIPAADLRDRALQAGMTFRTRGGGVIAGTSVGWHHVDDASWLNASEADFVQLRARLLVNRLTPAGHRILLRGHYRAVDRRAPGQWRTYLGDHGTLRGYRHAELSGDRGAWASLDVRWAIDPLRDLQVPLLKDLRLQPIVFADWGRTWNDDSAGPAPDPGDAQRIGTTGWRMDAGVGVGQLLGAPGLHGNVRLYAAHPVLDGVGEGWRFLLAFEN